MKLTELYELSIKAAQEAGSFLLKNKNLEKEIIWITNLPNEFFKYNFFVIDR